MAGSRGLVLFTVTLCLAASSRALGQYEAGAWTCVNATADGYCSPGSGSSPPPEYWMWHSEISPIDPALNRHGEEMPETVRFKGGRSSEQAIGIIGPQQWSSVIPPPFPGPWSPPASWRSAVEPGTPEAFRREHLETQVSTVEPAAHSQGAMAGQNIGVPSDAAPSRRATELDQVLWPATDPPILHPRIGAGQTADPMGDPVDPGRGELVFEHDDFTLSGIGIPVAWTRSYRSGWAYHGVLGHGWTHAYDQRLAINPICGAGAAIDWYTGTPGVVRFIQTGAGSWIDEAGSRWRLTLTGPNYELTHVDGQTNVFRASDGEISEIRDPNGNRLFFSYKNGVRPGRPAGPRLDAIVDTVGRVIHPTYDSRGYLQQVTVSVASLVMSYVVDARGDLVQFTNPSQLVERYTYDFDDDREAEPESIPTPMVSEVCKRGCAADASCGDPCAGQDRNVTFLECTSLCSDPQSCSSHCADRCVPACEAAIGQAGRDRCVFTCTQECVLPDTPEADAAFADAQRMKPHAPGSPSLAACLSGGKRECIAGYVNAFYPSQVPADCCLVADSGGILQSRYDDYLRNHVLTCATEAGALLPGQGCYARVQSTCQPEVVALGCEGTCCGPETMSYCRQRLSCAEYADSRAGAGAQFVWASGCEGTAQQVIGDFPAGGIAVCSLLSIVVNVVANALDGRGWWTGRVCDSQGCVDPEIVSFDSGNNMAIEDGDWECNHVGCLQHCNNCRNGCFGHYMDGCLSGAKPRCDAACNDACTGKLSDACAEGCTDACSEICEDEEPCRRACASLDTHRVCQNGCFEACVAANSGARRYGHPRALNHNLIDVIDGEDRVVVHNVYGVDPSHPSFDRIVRQDFGGEPYIFRHYDLTWPSAELTAEIEARGDAGRIAIDADAVDLCPSACETQLWPRGHDGRERWIEVAPSEYLVFGDLELTAESPPSRPVTVDNGAVSLGAFPWYELRRTGSASADIFPPIPLSGQLTIHFDKHEIHVVGEGPTSRLDLAGPQEAIDEAFGAGDVVTLVRSSRGLWRAVSAVATAAVHAGRDGVCSDELSVVQENGSVRVEQDACRGVVSFQLIGTRDGAPSSAFLAAAHWLSTWSFDPARPPVLHSARFGGAPGEPQPPVCLDLDVLVEPDPQCWAALEGWSAAPPEMPAPDCFTPWPVRASGLGLPGELPMLGCDFPILPPDGGGHLPPDCTAAQLESFGPPIPAGHEIAQATVAVEPDGVTAVFYATGSGRVVRKVIPANPSDGGDGGLVLRRRRAPHRPPRAARGSRLLPPGRGS
jgi:hypothetical protein